MSNTEARAALDAYHSRRRQAAGRSFVSSAAGYQRVLPRDVERRLERVFASMDKNHDWALEKAEVAQVLGTESDCMLDMVDVNKDYKVTIEEWMRYFNNLWQFMPDSVHHHIEVVERRVRGGSQYHATAVTAGYQRIVPPDVERQLDLLFQAIDRDGNGAIDKTECIAAAGREGPVMFDIDTNQDSKVTVEEWMKFFNHQWMASPDSVMCILEVMKKRLSLRS
eukprot:TRINITY_DN4220_c0_g2_i2.p1 TRINITY_DN4220_c0_g2~~TRINITY_DN4220_c0_g2_i2.p1  ORF type:complete len:223 (+),score=58.87 TRINITY_DN4220_c0_g2_i2:228-896(+)